MDEPLVPRVVVETPDNCDGCGAGRERLDTIEQEVKKPFGTIKRVVGYTCLSCTGMFLYR